MSLESDFLEEKTFWKVALSVRTPRVKGGSKVVQRRRCRKGYKRYADASDQTRLI